MHIVRRTSRVLFFTMIENTVCHFRAVLVLIYIVIVSSRVSHYHFNVAKTVKDALGGRDAFGVGLTNRQFAHVVNHKRSQVLNLNPSLSTAFLACGDYDTAGIISKELSAAAITHYVTFSTHHDNLICYETHMTSSQVNFVENSDSLQLSFLEALPDLHKLDRSVHHAQEFLSKPSSLSDDEELTRHPVVSLLQRGMPLGLSIMFNKGISEKQRKATVDSWFADLQSQSLEYVQTTMNSVFWLAASDPQHDAEEPPTRRRATLVTTRGLSKPRAGLPHLTSAAPRAADSSAVNDSLHLSAWTQWRDVVSRLSNDKALAQSCGFGRLSATHRSDSAYLPLPEEMTRVGAAAREMTGACLSLLLAAASSDPAVSRVALTQPMKTMNNVARQIVQSGSRSNSEPFSAAGLNGTGMVIGVSDTGIDESSCFFRDPVHGKVPRSDVDSVVTDHKYRKVIQYVNFSSSGGDYADGHGTHVSGTLAGHCANESADVNAAWGLYHGMAPEAKLAFFDIGVNDKQHNLVLPYELAEYLYPPAYKAGARVHSNSWGGGYLYDGYCMETDRFLYEQDDFLILFAAGNDGGRYETIVSPGLSKNAIAVGCSENQRPSTNVNAIASFSSVGPTPDGRLKPDIVAPGYSVTSARASSESSEANTCRAISKAGTSMATPVTAGIAALIHQYFSDGRFWATYCDRSYAVCRRGAFAPSGYLLKALILQSGAPMSVYNAPGSAVGKVELGQTPDSFQGYGRVDMSNILPLVPAAEAAFNLFVTEGVLSQLTELTFNVIVRSSAYPLKATISWFDPPNEVFSARVLLHDIDLLVVAPNGLTYLGNAHSVDGLPALGAQRDEVNTNEQVLVAAPMPGEWVVRVQAKRLTQAPQQKFALVITGSGVVVPNETPLPISPQLLMGCSYRAGRPFSEPRLSVDLSLWARVKSTGWGAQDSYHIASTAQCEAVPGQPLISESGQFTSSFAYEVQSTCLPAGCYTASLSFGADPKPGVQMGIAQCNGYLAPMAPVHSFQIARPVIDTSNNISLFAQNSCIDICRTGAHFDLPLLLGEEQGGGWTGTYYSLLKVSNLDSKASFATQAVAAGSMEWGFEVEQTKCLPAASACYALQLSVPDKTEEFPQLYFLNSFADAALSRPCTHVVDQDVTLAKFCTAGGGGVSTVTFYSQGSKDFGQTGPVSWDAFVAGQKSSVLRSVGQCYLPLTLSSGTQTSAVPSQSPTTMTSVPSQSPTTKTSVPSQSTTRSMQPTVFEGHSTACLRGCSGYPGDEHMGRHMNTTCSFLAGLFDRCDSYSVAYGLCPLADCARSCSAADWCYFGSGAVTSCPYAEWQGHTLAATEIATQCTASVQAANKASAEEDVEVAAGFHLSDATQTLLIVGAAIVAVLVLVAAVQWCRKSAGQSYSLSIDASSHNSASLMSASRKSGVVVVEGHVDASSHGTAAETGGASSAAADRMRQIAAKGGRMVKHLLKGGAKPKDSGKKGEYQMVGAGQAAATHSPFTILSGEDDEETFEQTHGEADEEESSF